MTDRLGPLYDWIKIALGAVFVLGISTWRTPLGGDRDDFNGIVARTRRTAASDDAIE